MTEHPESRPPSGETPLESWKEIATYLNRGVRTVKRWEQHEGLPVHRHLHRARSSVYAYRSELDAWWATRRPVEEAAPPGPGPRLVRALSFATMLLLALVVSGGGMIMSPGARAAQEPGLTARRILDRISYGTVSPDGRFLTDVDWDTGDLAVVDIATRTMRRLTDKGPWTQSSEYAELSVISPDSRQIAYAWFNGRTYDLRLINTDGSEPRVLYSHADAEYVLPAGWSPDGRHVAATISRGDTANQIVLVSVADGTSRTLRTFDWRFPVAGPFTPDGRGLVYRFPPQEEAPSTDIYLLALDGSRETPLVVHPAHDEQLGWSEDGQELVFRSNRTGGFDLWTLGVRDGRPDGAPRLVKANLGRITPIGLTRGGALFYGVHTSLRDAVVAPLGLAAGTGLGTPVPVQDELVGTTLWPRWSRDGRTLVYLKAGTGLRQPIQIVLRSLDTGDERTLAPDLVFDHAFHFRPSLSPDGRTIVLATKDRRGRQGLYLVDAQTAAVTPLVRAETAELLSLPDWSPDGAHVYYLRAGERAAILERHLASGRERVVYPQADNASLRSFSLSRDGERVAFIQIERTAPATSVLFEMPIRGGPPRAVFEVTDPVSMVGPAAPGWTSDGRFVIVRTFRNGTPEAERRLWAVGVRGDGTMPLGEAPEGFLLGFDVHPDGRQIAFTAGMQKEELWMMENFLSGLKALR